MSAGQQRPRKYCQACGVSIDAAAVICPSCGVAQPNSTVPPPIQNVSTPSHISEANSKKLAAGLCGIFLGLFGVHKFILGYQTAGLIMLLVTVLTFFLGGFVMGIIGLVEGIIYLTKSDEEFYQTYIARERQWF
tara:strand:- start:226 stop:627 length:402 start_codon:yes stop_codon:yes gene_type:complete